MIYETWAITLTPKALERLEPAIRQAAEEEWEDEQVQTELMNHANDIHSRLQRIARGDVQE